MTEDAHGPDERDPIPAGAREGDGDGYESAGDRDEEGSESYAPEPSSTPIEPEAPSLEGSVFVLLGAAVTVLVLLRMGGILGG